MGLSLYQELDAMTRQILNIEKEKNAYQEAFYGYIKEINSCRFKERCDKPSLWNVECTCGVETLRRMKAELHDNKNDI